jgi:hypothetical protein
MPPDPAFPKGPLDPEDAKPALGDEQPANATRAKPLITMPPMGTPCAECGHKSAAIFCPVCKAPK